MIHLVHPDLDWFVQPPPLFRFAIITGLCYAMLVWVGFGLTACKLMDYYVRKLEKGQIFREIGDKSPFSGWMKPPQSRLVPAQQAEIGDRGLETTKSRCLPHNSDYLPTRNSEEA